MSSDTFSVKELGDVPTPKVAPRQAVHIKPIHGWTSLDLKELWEYRELLVFLTWRDIRVRYKQTILGFAWAVLQPLFTMVVFNVIFNRVAGMTSDGIPYPLFSFAALVPFYFFSNSLTQSSNSILQSSAMIKKIYFPRLAVPIASVMAGLIDFALSFSVLLGMVAFYVIFTDYQLTLSVNMLFIPLLLLLVIVTSLGLGLWFAALNAQFRDVRYTVPFLIQALLFMSPIAYPISTFPREVQLLAAINPITGVAEGFRWALLGADTRPGPMIIISAVVAVFLMISGAYYFRRMEKHIADVV